MVLNIFHFWKNAQIEKYHKISSINGSDNLNLFEKMIEEEKNKGGLFEK